MDVKVDDDWHGPLLLRGAAIFTLLCPGAVEFGDGAGVPLGAAVVEGALAGERVWPDLLQLLAQGDAFTLVLGAADLLVEVEQAARGEGAEQSAHLGDCALVMAFRFGGGDLGLSEVEDRHVSEGAHRSVEVLGRSFMYARSAAVKPRSSVSWARTALTY
ncbi:hypothetical protein ACIBBB_23255 [Streptomyces sp. NPDC051217]|uniref:hypothetical protein n=1 Tax=Streptomyces sp. NPDC051217 TaxID=3365644 RepID=UPI0037A94B0D